MVGLRAEGVRPPPLRTHHSNWHFMPFHRGSLSPRKPSALTRDAARQLALVHRDELAAQLAGVDLAGARDAAGGIRNHLLPLLGSRMGVGQAVGW